MKHVAAALLLALGGREISTILLTKKTRKMLKKF